jgi:sodium transport system ATP-binding protein
MLHDDFGLYPRLTIIEHVRFSAQLHGLSGRTLSKAVDSAIAALGLDDIRNRFTAGLSHGQRMKTALARTIVHSPRNLVLDEPTRGLDVFSVRVLRELLRRLRSEGVCILMSSHAMSEVMELSDRLIVIDQGKLLAEGTPAEIIAKGGGGDLETAFLRLTGAAA